MKSESNGVILGATLSFPETALPAGELTRLRMELTFKGMDGKKFGFGSKDDVCLFEQEGGIVSLPRRFAQVEVPGLFESASVSVSQGEDVDFVFNHAAEASRQVLADRQDAAVVSFIQKMGIEGPGADHFWGGILSAPCGVGKTVMVLKMLTVLGKNALVLVHKDFLMDQWVERIIAFLDVTREEIGFIKRDVCSFTGKKIVVGMIQSLTTRDYPPALYDHFGVVVVDEVHRMGAPVFNTAIPKFSAACRIGVTATPKRADGLQEVFEWHIGPVLEKMEGHEVTPKIYQVPFEIEIPDSQYRSRDKIFLGKLTTILSKNERRNRFLVVEMVKAVRAGRRVMILSDRREHLEKMKAAFEAVPDLKATCGFYVGGMKKEEREMSEKADAIFATFQMVKEGLDIPAIDTLFLATPHGDVQQPVGRILRWHEDKKDPIVVDIVDTVSTCEKFAKKRLWQYKKLKYDVIQSV